MKRILFILLIAFVFASCSDTFLETQNKNNLDVGSFWKTKTDMELAVNAAYCPLAYGGMFGLNYFLNLNTLDPYIWFESPKGGFDQLLINTNDFKSTWSALYQGLFRTSDILANIEKVRTVVNDDSIFNQNKGQVTALRGMYYFYMVTWFNAPIYYDETDVPTDPMVPLTNGTQEQFWTKLEEDLNFATTHLPATWPSSETGRITKGAAYAQLGKALLYKHYHYYLRFGKGSTAEAMENLVKAKTALKAVIESGNYKLIQSLSNDKTNEQAAILSNFSYLDIPVGTNTYKAENNAESVWEIQYNDDNRGQGGWLPGWQWGGNLLNEYFAPLPSCYRNLEIDPTLWLKFEARANAPEGYKTKIDPRAYATCYIDGDTLDWRKSSGQNVPFQSGINSKKIVLNNNLFTGSDVLPSKSFGLKKYFYPQWVDKSPLCDPVNVRVIRFADVLLMYAEVCFQLDGDADGTGLAALNEVRSRAGMPSKFSLNVEIIVNERTFELATEGHHYNDIIRWSFDSKFDVVNNLDVLFNSRFNKPKNQYFPIPQTDIDSNKGALKQNPGW